jgi:hypothetical protein
MTWKRLNIRERLGRPVITIHNDGPVLDDLEYTDYYKTNAPDCNDGRKSTERFIARMNKRNDPSSEAT